MAGFFFTPPTPRHRAGLFVSREELVNLTVFEEALKQVLKWEGGYVNDPRDPGGATAYGITTATYDAWRRKQGQTTRPVSEIERREVEAIYWQQYWLRAGCDQLDPTLALVVFDAAVNSGAGAALKWLAQTKDWREYNTLRLDFLTGLGTWAAFGKGWVRRIADLTRAAVEMDAQARDRLLLVFDGDGREAARVPLDEADLLIRVRGSRVYVRPDGE